MHQFDIIDGSMLVERGEFIRSLDFDKAAVFGENFLTRSLVSQYLGLAKKGFVVQNKYNLRTIVLKHR